MADKGKDYMNEAVKWLKSQNGGVTPQLDDVLRVAEFLARVDATY